MIRPVALCLLLMGLVGCVAPPVQKIALLAPFEGRYRDVGYNALYAARLALEDHGDVHTHLLAVDDGGSAEHAMQRAQALERDPAINAVIVMGVHAAQPQTLQAFERLPVLVVGNWGDGDILELAARQAPFTCDDLCALEQFAELRDDLSGVTVVSGGTLPDAAFKERYLNSGMFVPEPNLLATSVYAATLRALQGDFATTNAATNAYTYTAAGTLQQRIAGVGQG